MPDKQWDVCVIGGGPSGLEAAASAADCGLETLVLDERALPGGHVYMGLESPFADSHMDPAVRRQGRETLRRFRESGAIFFARRTVWHAEPGEIIASHAGRSAGIRARALIVANGAMERPVPFSGWTLPGVMGAGGAELLMRSAGVLPQGPVVLAGNGPLLLLTASGLLAAGVECAAFIDTGGLASRLPALALLPGALLDLSYLGKGLGMALRILRKGLPLIRGTILRAAGKGRLEEVVCATARGERRIRCNTLLVHEGFIPRTHFSRLLRCAHIWQTRCRCWLPDCDARGASRNVPGLFFTGDGLAVEGADAALLKGRLAGIAAASHLGAISEAEAGDRSAGARRALGRLRIARAYVDALFRPDPALYAMPDDTLLCRCEHVTAGRVRRAVAEGCFDVNEIKTRTRAGMGQCQGRMCGQAMAEVAAAALGRSPEAAGLLSARPPVRPVPMREFCGLETE